MTTPAVRRVVGLGPNRRGPEGTADALRASNPAAVPDDQAPDDNGGHVGAVGPDAEEQT